MFNPVMYLLERLERWATKPFDDIYNEVEARELYKRETDHETSHDPDDWSHHLI